MEKIEIPIPDEVKVSYEGNILTVKGEKGSIARTFKIPSVTISISDRMAVVSTSSTRKKDIAILGAVRSRISNMLHGVQRGYEYRLKIFYAHFPMNVSVDGNRVKIDNFLGEKYPRYAAIVGNTQVQVRGDVITVTGIDKETVGQTAANLEQATRIRKRDPRVFQDGIYLYEIDGVKLK